MPGLAFGDQSQPGDALLRGLDQVEPQVVGDGDREAAHLADRLRAALEDLGVRIRQPQRALLTAGLLVGGEHEPQRPARRLPGSSPRPDHAQHHGVEVLHVDGAPPPEAAVDDLPGERWLRPVVGVRRNHIEVPVDQQRAHRAVGALRLPVGHQRRPARVPARTTARRCRPRPAGPRRVRRPPARRAPDPGRSSRCRSGSGHDRARPPRRRADRPRAWRHPVIPILA